MKEIIEQVVSELQEDFSRFPFKYTSSEQEAQFRVFHLLLSKYIKGSIKINRSGQGGPVPPFENEASPRIKLEWQLNSRKHDIVIFKEGVIDPSSYNDVEAAIEIKSTWGDYPHLGNDGFLKDFEFVHDYPNVGFLIAFIANTFRELSQSRREYYEKSFECLRNDPKHAFNPGQVFLIFRDRVLK